MLIKKNSNSKNDGNGGGSTRSKFSTLKGLLGVFRINGGLSFGSGEEQTMSNSSSIRRISIAKDDCKHLIERHDGECIMCERQAEQRRPFALDFETMI